MIFLNDCFQIARCNHFWDGLTSSIVFFMRNQDSLQLFMWGMDGSQRIMDPWFEEQTIYSSQYFDWEGVNSWYSAASLGNSVTYFKQSWCYEVFGIHHDFYIWTFWLFDSLLPSAACQEACNITARWKVLCK